VALLVLGALGVRARTAGLIVVEEASGFHHVQAQMPISNVEFVRRKGKLGFLATPLSSPDLACPIGAWGTLHELILPGAR
jgi:hypothetical protein